MANNGPDNSGQINKVISYIKDGLFAIYYCGNDELAAELSGLNGTVIHRSGSVPDGTVREYYKDGPLRRSVQFKDGSEQGLCIEYYPSGTIFEENTYRRGVLHGPSRTYRQDGELWMEALYKNGQLHGTFTNYYEDGGVESRAEYVNGKLHGPYAAYNRHRFVLQEGTFVRGKKQGVYRVYHDTGHPSRIEKYKQGRLVSCQEFDEDGKVILVMGTREKYARR